MRTSTSAASALLILLAGAASAQQTDPRRIDPLTGEPRRMFEPTSYEESQVVLRACLDRELARVPAAQAVQTCQEEALAACEAIMALYPLARNTCALGVRLAWSDIRNQAGLDLYDLTLSQAREAGPEGEAAAQPRLDAILARDEAWRIESADACRQGDDAATEACRLDRDMSQAALYLGETVDLLGGPAAP